MLLPFKAFESLILTYLMLREDIEVSLDYLFQRT